MLMVNRIATAAAFLEQVEYSRKEWAARPWPFEQAVLKHGGLGNACVTNTHSGRAFLCYDCRRFICECDGGTFDIEDEPTCSECNCKPPRVRKIEAHIELYGEP